MRLQNKVAVITGGASGLGRGDAELFSANGAAVVIAGRRLSEGEKVARSIRGNNKNDCVFVQTDVSNPEQTSELMVKAKESFGKIDILFNNAGINNHLDGDPHNEEIEIFESVINVNLKGAFLCTKYAVPYMIENGQGSIINNSSVLDSRAANNSSTSYHVSKGGLAMLTKKSALAYAKYNIRVNTIQPGAIATEMSGINWDDLTNESVIKRRSDIQPLQKMGHPYDVGYAALYFASDESEFVTGSTLLVDGGMSAAYAPTR